MPAKHDVLLYCTAMLESETSSTPARENMNTGGGGGGGGPLTRAPLRASCVLRALRSHLDTMRSRVVAALFLASAVDSFHVNTLGRPHAFHRWEQSCSC